MASRKVPEDSASTNDETSDSGDETEETDEDEEEDVGVRKQRSEDDEVAKSVEDIGSASGSTKSKTKKSVTESRASDSKKTGSETSATGLTTEAPPVKILSDEEETRAKRIFMHCDTYGEGLDVDGFCVALALLGQVEKVEKVRDKFKSVGLDRIDCETFMDLLTSLRLNLNSEEIDEEILEMFEALYQGTCPDDSQRDEGGNRFLTAKAFRLVMTTQGEVLTDEEADEIVKECHPVWEVEPKTGVRTGKIYYENYRSMLLDTGS